MKHQQIRLAALEAGLLLFVLAYLFPVLVMVYNGFKSYGEIMTDILAFPQTWTWANFVAVWTDMNVPGLFLNNLIITLIGVTGILAVGALAGFKLSRTKTKTSWVLFLLFILPMLIPFQASMITVLKLARTLGLSGSVVGLGIQYWGFGAPLAVFLYHGFVKSLPVELDEAALIDGAGRWQSFSRITFPLMSPMTFTILVVDVMWIWNDYLLPLIMVNSVKETRTLTLAVYAYFGQYVSNYGYAIAALVIAVLPSVVFFLFLQRHVVKGVTAGAVKG
jgi:raffinose/stachyose/melibiose transport system permease protein